MREIFNPDQWTQLLGKSKQYRHKTTGEVISRRKFDSLKRGENVEGFDWMRDVYEYRQRMHALRS